MTALESITVWMTSQGFNQTKVEPLAGDIKAHVFTHVDAALEQRFYFDGDGSLAQIGSCQMIDMVTDIPPMTKEQFINHAERLAKIGMTPVYFIKSDDDWVTTSAAYMSYRTTPELDATQGSIFLLQLGLQLGNILKSENRHYQFASCDELAEVQKQLGWYGNRSIVHTCNGYFRDDRLGDGDLVVVSFLAKCMVNAGVWHALTGKDVTPTVEETKRTHQYIEYLKDKFSIPVSEMFKGSI
jgi:hypothetical protein